MREVVFGLSVLAGVTFAVLILLVRRRRQRVSSAPRTRRLTALTAPERRFIIDRGTAGEPTCPDCRRGDLVAGPRAPAGTQVRCDRCGAHFWLEDRGPNVRIWRIPEE